MAQYVMTSNDGRCGDRRKLLAESVDRTEPASGVADVVDRQMNGGSVETCFETN
jgi:hypothetical protein